MKDSNKHKNRLSRSEWLDRSLDLLSENKGHFRIDALVKKLGVTKGSFYWHFKNRDDFVHSLLNHWAETSTMSVLEQMDKYQNADAEKRLLGLMRILSNKEYSCFDIAIRNMAAWSEEAANTVISVDKARLDIVSSLFKELGFRGKDLEVRVHIFAVFQSLRQGFLGKEMSGSNAELKAMHKFFIRK